MSSVNSGKKPSSRLLGMKFMQRSLEKEQQEQLEKERKRVISEAEWVLDTKEIDVQKPKIQIQTKSSFLPFVQDTMSGRRSFKSFNKAVEKKEIEEENAQRSTREEEVENANKVSDNEMAKQVSSIRSVSKKTKKRKTEDGGGNSKKAKATKEGFIRPE